jgi:hypothetical protein
VPRESSRIGLPGDKEHIVVLNGDHNGICRFGSSQADEDNLKIVQGNISDLYKAALKAGELGQFSKEAPSKAVGLLEGIKLSESTPAF